MLVAGRLPVKRVVTKGTAVVDACDRSLSLRLRRVAAALTMSVVVTTGAAVAGGPAAAEPGSPPVEPAPPEATSTPVSATPLDPAASEHVDARLAARVTAARSGKPVELPAERDEVSRRFVNPDGTVTLEQSTVPRFVRQDEEWVPVDPTLRRERGQVRPSAAVLDLSFSGGGEGPIATVETGGHRLALSLPWPLPEPELAGPRATYREVLPGVDLVLTADPDGFSEVLVVKDRAAAERPELAALRLAVATTGLTLKPMGGGFVAVDDAGEPVFTSPAPRMWDSSGMGDREPGRPNDGDRVADMALTVGRSELVVTPDLELLRGPDTVYPVYLDPSVSGSRNEWAMISDGYPGESYYKFSGDEGVGYCDVSREAFCRRNQVKRLVWEFGLPSVLRGARVFAATFSAYETSAYDCTPREVQLWRTATIDSGTTWNNHRNGWSERLASATVARRSGCSQGPGRVEFNAVEGARDAAAGNWSSLTLGLRAANESSMPGGWKRFRNDATLSITYNSRPTTPTGLDVADAGCATGAARPVLGDATPTLRASVHDPDTETDLRARFAWEVWQDDAWVPLGTGEQHSLRDGQQGRYQITSGLTSGGIYRFRAQTVDPWSYGGTSGTDTSNWSGWCEFEVDTEAPHAAPQVSSPVYGPDLNQFYGSVGLTADFTFTAAGVEDVARYRWGWADPPTTEVAAAAPGASVTVPLTPPPPQPEDPTAGGLITLYVRSVDRAGNLSPVTRYPFNIGSAAEQKGRWELADPAGVTTLVDSSGNGHHATVQGVTTGVPGRLVDGPTAASFDGSLSGGAATAGPVVRTDQSYTVAAWVRLASKDGWATAVAQQGNRVSGLLLQYEPSTDRWALAGHHADADVPVTVRARSSAPAQAGVWTHLAGVYDAGARELRIYVNGVRSGTAAYPDAWHADGPLLIGREWHNGAVVSPWRGDLADVKVWDRVLSDAEIAPMAATLVGRWRLDGDGTDATVWGRDATGSPAGWVADRTGTDFAAAEFDGSTATLQTAGPALRTDQPFTVSAWLSAREVPQRNGTAVGQDGAQISGFFLGYRTTTTPGPWAFIVRSTDSTNSGTWQAGGGSLTPGRWTHVVGVYDPAAGQVRLYVDGELAATANAGSGWHADGPLTIGRAKWQDPTDWFDGFVDDVRVYQGVLPPSEIDKLYQP